MRLINPSTVGTPILFSIDNHTLTVIANDFTPVVRCPYRIMNLLSRVWDRLTRGTTPVCSLRTNVVGIDG